MKVNAYLNFNGRCEEAFKFYADVLGGSVGEFFRFGDTPMAAQTPADWQNKVMHGTMTVDGVHIMGSDAPPDRYQAPGGFSMSLHIDTAEEAERVFHKLAEGGQVRMPIAETFWAERFGMLVDRFGIPWMINCEKMPVEPPISA